MKSTPIQGTIGALLGNVAIDATQSGSVAVYISGTFSATLTFEGTIDGTNWFSAPAWTVASPTVGVTSATAAGQWQMSSAGFSQVRVNCPTTYVSGTATVTLGPTASPQKLGSIQSSLLNGLKAYYAFETLITDSSGNGNTLTNNASVTQATGIIGQAASFTAASSQFFNVADNSSLHFASSMSVSLWVKPTTVGANQCLISKGLLATTLEWDMQLLANGTTQFCIGDVNNGRNALAGSTTLSSGTWYNIVSVFDGTQSTNATKLKTWINGVSQTLTFPGSAMPSTTQQLGGDMFIGKLGGAAPQFTNGLLDEVGLWNVALTATQVAALYNSGVGVTWPFVGVP